MSYLVQRLTSRLMPDLWYFGVLVLFGVLVSSAAAQAVVRDTEIENALRVYMQPLLKAANLDDERLIITVIQDPNINATVLPNGQILVHTGSLRQAEDPTEIAGMLAHELGHYVNNDILKLTGKFAESQQISLAGIALGLGLALATQSPELLIAGQLLGQHVGVRNQLQFTRSMESGADRRASELLHRSGLGFSGILALNQRLLENYPDPAHAEAKYLQTHPLTQDRITYFARQLQRLGARSTPLGWQRIHDRVRAKLQGFSDAPQEVLMQYSEGVEHLPGQMARAIALMRLARYGEAIALMQAILAEHSEDGFLYDLMGDIQRQAGREDQALQYYGQAIKRLPWASLIRYQRAGLWLKKATSAHALAARDDLLQAVRFEPEVPGYWHSLAHAYRLLDESGEADLALAEAALLEHKPEQSKAYALRAKRGFSVNSATWLRADDIVKQVEAKRKGS
ncbi:MAG: M48 family metalloprotease [Alphaproteobacteria bacterium]|nr:M48 family metalloprotease [Alphaproteobacteria bacterium]